MDLIKRKGEKVGPIKDVMHKFKYSFQGFLYCYTHETSFIFETIGVIAIIIFGIIFKITFMQIKEWFSTNFPMFLRKIGLFANKSAISLEHFLCINIK